MRICNSPIDPEKLRQLLIDDAAGGFVAFEGWVRNENEGQEVLRLEYEVYAPLAVKEGAKIIEETMAKFPVLRADCAHREGLLEIGRMRRLGWRGLGAQRRGICGLPLHH